MRKHFAEHDAGRQSLRNTRTSESLFTVRSFCTYSLFCLLLSLGCTPPKPNVIEARFPSHTSDEGGPYQLSVHTWGTIDSIQIQYGIDDLDEEVFDTASMIEVQTNYWTGSIPGAPRGSQVVFRLRINGPGGTILYPRSGPHRFDILGDTAECRPECTTGEICLDGRCRTPSICLNDRQCAEGDVCQRGECIPAQGACESDDQCPDTLRCDNGECISECTGAADCPEREMCTDGRCITSEPDCEQNDECASEQICIDGQCMDVDEPCPDGCADPLFCEPESGRCIECVSDEECGPGSVCIQSENRCTEPCGQDANEPNNAVDNATNILSNSVISARSCPTDVDFFQTDEAADALKILGLEQQNTAAIVVFYLENEPLEEVYVETEDTIPLLSRTFSITAANIELDYEVFTFREGGPIQCEEDVFEPNDLRNQATLIGSQGALVSANICPGNSDWFGIRRRRRDGPGQVMVKTTGPSLEVEVSHADGEPISQERLIGLPNRIESDDVGPWVIFNYGDPRETVFLNFDCALCGNLSPAYWIATRTEEASEPCPEDEFEPNESPDQAVVLGRAGESVELPEVNVCGRSDDWYVIEKTGDQAARFTIEFVRQRGDIDLFLYSSDLELIAYDIDGRGTHQVGIDQDRPDGRYFIRVALFGSGSLGYEARIEP